MREAVGVAKQRWEGSEEWRVVEADSPQYDLSDDKPLAVWADGGVDPRALGGLAALWHTMVHQECEWPTQSG